jgi:hypothetical protein
MAQTNFTPISLYYSTTAAAAPTAGNLVAGELAINTADGKLFYKDSSGVVQTIASKDTNSGTFTNITVSGVASFADGTVSLPSITNIGDTNTGIFFPAADTIAFTEGGAEAMRIDSSGQVGIGTTSPNGLLHVNGTINIGSQTQNSTSTAVLENRVTSDPASTARAAITLGTTAGTSSSDSYIAFTTNQYGVSRAERMRIDSSGNVGIGTSSPSSYFSEARQLVIAYSSGSTGATIVASTAGNSNLFFADGTTGDELYRGFVQYGHGNDSLRLGTAATERMRIDSSGNCGIGTSSPSNKLTVVGGVQLQTGTFPASGNGLELTFTSANTAFIQAYDRGTATWRDISTGGATLQYSTGGTERMRIDSSGNLLVGTTTALHKLTIVDTNPVTATFKSDSASGSGFYIDNSGRASGKKYGIIVGNVANGALSIKDETAGAERLVIDSSGNLLVGTTVYNDAFKGILLSNNGRLYAIADGAPSLTINRLTSDGDLVEFKQAGTVEGTISVSGTTVSYNGGHLSRYAQTTTAKDESLVKGTVLSNLDEMNVYVDSEGNPVSNEQLNKVKVSDVEGDGNVAGVFVNWSHDEQHNVDEINMAMTGDMIIRIADGVVVQKGDLLMSAGDGTAKPQGDDIVRSKTIAKVTSNYVTCTYADGSYCVPCVLMAC